MEKKEFIALVSLLDDPDKEIFSHVSNKLLSYGTGIIPDLESVWEGSADPVVQTRIENLIQKIHFDGLLTGFKNWLANPDDLFEGVFLATQFQYPELKKEVIKNKLDILKRSIWLELNLNLTPLEQVNIFNHVFYTIQEFSGKSSMENNPDQLLINKVLETKKGNSLSLGILYLLIAQGLDIPVYGVDLVKHFVLAYTKVKIDIAARPTDLRDKVMFYINPLNRGTIFSRNEIASYLKKFGEVADVSNFVPCSNKTIVQLLLQELKGAYDEDGQAGKVSDLRTLLGLF